MYATFPAHHILLHMIILKALVEGTKLEDPPYVVLIILLVNPPCVSTLFPQIPRSLLLRTHYFPPATISSHSHQVRTFDSKTTHDSETQRRQSGSRLVPTDATFSCPALSAPHDIASSLGDLRTAKWLPAPPHSDCTKFGRRRLLVGRELPFARV